jgi:exonuclease III
MNANLTFNSNSGTNIKTDGNATQLKPFVAEDAIICLQELSITWTGRATAWFQRQGYSLISTNYGSEFNGFV